MGDKNFLLCSEKTCVILFCKIASIIMFADKVNAEGIRRRFPVPSMEFSPEIFHCKRTAILCRARSGRSNSCGSRAKCYHNHDNIKLDQLIGKYNAKQKDMLLLMCVQVRIHIFGTLCILYLTLYVNTQKISFSELGLRMLWKEM